MHHTRSLERFPFPTPLSALLLALLSCSAPGPTRATGAGVLDAPDRDPVLQAAALELLPPREGSCIQPLEALACADPSRPEFWMASADAFGGSQQQARRRALAVLGELAAAGAPAPVQVAVTDHTFEGDAPLLETAWAFDLYGLLGWGPRETEALHGRARVDQALAEYERTLFEGRLEALRARAALGAALSVEREREVLLGELEQGAARITLLEKHGRISAAMADAARGMVGRAERMASMARVDVASARARLALATGRAANDPALDHVTPEVLAERASIAGSLRPEHPALRAAAEQVALTEARVRMVARQAWPSVQIGPHLGFPEGDLDPLKLGGILRLNLPWPSSWEGRLAAAEEQREAALEAWDEQVLALGRAESEARVRLEQAEMRLKEASRALASGSQEAWRRARLALVVAEATPADWVDALERRIPGSIALVQDELAMCLSTLDLMSAVGHLVTPLQGVEPAAAPASLEGAR